MTDNISWSIKIRIWNAAPHLKAALDQNNIKFLAELVDDLISSSQTFGVFQSAAIRTARLLQCYVHLGAEAIFLNLSNWVKWGRTSAERSIMAGTVSCLAFNFNLYCAMVRITIRRRAIITYRCQDGSGIIKGTREFPWLSSFVRLLELNHFLQNIEVMAGYIVFCQHLGFQIWKKKNMFAY